MSESPVVVLMRDDASAIDGAPRDARWLFVDGASDFGGHEVMLLRLLEELAAQRTVKTFILARTDSRLQHEAARHSTLFDLPAERPGKLQRVFGAIRDAVALVRTVLEVRPHVCIVAEGCLLSQPLFAILARLMGQRVIVYVPLVQTSMSMGFARGKSRDAFVRRLYARVPHAWITITREQATDFRDWSGTLAPILTLPNTVTHAIENDLLARAPIDRGTHKRLRVVVLGRLDEHQKGIDMLLEFLVAHPELGSSVSINFVGSGPFEQQIWDRIAQNFDLARWVSLQPWSPAIDVMRGHDVLLMTSRYEGVPLVMLEGMALGVPVVAPDLPGTRAFLAADCLFPRNDIAAAFRIIERMQDPLVREQTAERNREAFRLTASNAAFAMAVRTLTQQIRAFEHETLQQRSA